MTQLIMPPKKRGPPAGNSLDPVKMKVSDLKEELEKRSLQITGKKPDLVARLETALRGPSVSPSKKAKVEITDSGTREDYSKMKVTELKKELKSRGLNTSGNKAELTARLQGAENQPETSATVSFYEAVRALTSTKCSTEAPREHKVDSFCTLEGATVVEDWNCLLNQTDIGQNKNKFYIIQLLDDNWNFIVWTRWGRVGEPGHSAEKIFSEGDEAQEEFKKKFFEKTKNHWDNRDNFVPVPGKYTLIENENGDDDDGVIGVNQEKALKLAAVDEPDGAPLKVRPCTLNQPTQTLVRLIFNMDMFKHAMKSLEIDIRKIPLGKLSKAQIVKGFKALEAVETALDANAPRQRLSELTSQFYTIIPHDFHRKVPPPIVDKETLQKKFDMLMVLGEIEVAQDNMQKNKESEPRKGHEVPHQLDVLYESLNADLVLLDPLSHEHQVIMKYFESTRSQWTNIDVQHVWKVNRQNVEERFSEHACIKNRRLLWHGTSMAVVAAILMQGLRIMPHSSGRVGKGIYFSSEFSQSAGRMRSSEDGTGIIFLAEVALGKECRITKPDGSLTSPPAGYDSVIGKGKMEPHPSADTTLTLDGRSVKVPQGKPVPTSYPTSIFYQSEYIIYKESQIRIRYMLQTKYTVKQ